MKVWAYMTIMLTMMVFLSFIGFQPAGTAEPILNATGMQINQSTGELTTSDVSGSDWYKSLFNKSDGLIAFIATLVVIAVGLVTRSVEYKLALVPFFLFFVAQFTRFGWGVVQLARDTGDTWLIAIVATIFVPMTAMFLFSIVEWFGGSPSD